MTNPLYFSRASIRRDARISALLPLIVPDGHARTAAGHHLVWTLFADSRDRTRDFLWREADSGTFYLLSSRPPEDHHGIFDLEPPKLFAPRLRAGMSLAFSLRANATIARGGKLGVRSKPCDVVMDAIYQLPKGHRAEARGHAIARAGRTWLAAQGKRHGFTVSCEDDETVRVMGYQSIQIGRQHGKAMRIGVLDFEGTLCVDEPDRFLTAITQGFGRAKAFGCGLMLIRPI